ncbi:MAG: hypothetical protein JSR98_17800 [Proteobacteria bacterium]|nr:hypothetical protein [Pseudomonadota bacterium]
MTDHDRFNQLTAAGVPPSSALDVLSGKTSEAEALATARQRKSAAVILALAPKDRPRPSLAWDLSPANWHRALDGCDPTEFGSLYADVAVFSVGRRDLLAAFSPYARRKAGPWSERYRSKTARLVAHLDAGGRVTPPLVTQVPQGLALAGGYHRLGWAHYRRIGLMPILLSRALAPTVARLVPSLIDDGGAAAGGV